MQAVAQQPRRSPLEKAKHALEQLTAPSDAQPAAAPLEQGQEEQLLLTSPAPPGTGDQAAACRPWDRRDLFRRLRSFRSGTWFGKPDVAGSLQCASHGWLNTDPDTLRSAVLAWYFRPLLHAQARQGTSFCSSGRPQLALWSSWTPHMRLAAPGRATPCDRGLGAFPALPAAAMLRSWQAAAKALSRLSCLPPLKAQELQAILASHRPQLLSLLRADVRQLSEAHSALPAPADGLHGQNSGQPAEPVGAFARSQHAPEEAAALDALLCQGSAGSQEPGSHLRVRLLAMCGWQVAHVSGAAVATTAASLAARDHCLQCTLCGACEGLWLYLPEGAEDGLRLRRTGSGVRQRPAVLAMHNIAGGTSAAAAIREGAPAVPGPFGSTGAPVLGPAAGSGGRPFGAPSSGPAFGAAAAAVAPAKASEPLFGLRARRSSSTSAAAASAVSRPSSADPAAPSGRPEDASQTTAGVAADASRVDKKRKWHSLSPEVAQPFSLQQAHRPFCPWHSRGSDGRGRCGWQWTLDVLVPLDSSCTAHASAPQGRGDPAARLRQLLKGIGPV